MQGNQMTPQRAGDPRQDWAGEIGGPVYQTAPTGQGSALPGLESGMGGYHGPWSFRTFSHEKSILKRWAKPDITLRYAPFKGKMGLLKKLI